MRLKWNERSVNIDFIIVGFDDYENRLNGFLWLLFEGKKKLLNRLRFAFFQLEWTNSNTCDWVVIISFLFLFVFLFSSWVIARLKLWDFCTVSKSIMEYLPCNFVCNVVACFPWGTFFGYKFFRKLLFVQ